MEINESAMYEDLMVPRSRGRNLGNQKTAGFVLKFY